MSFVHVSGILGIREGDSDSPGSRPVNISGGVTRSHHPYIYK